MTYSFSISLVGILIYSDFIWTKEHKKHTLRVEKFFPSSLNLISKSSKMGKTLHLIYVCALTSVTQTSFPLYGCMFFKTH